jgi:hypothetical protein
MTGKTLAAILLCSIVSISTVAQLVAGDGVDAMPAPSLTSPVPSNQKGRDLSKLDACKIVTPADVAAATNRKVIKSVGGQVHCSYVVDAPQSGADTYDLYLNEAAVTEALLAVTPGKERGTPVPGLWSEAYVGPAIGSPKQLSLVALRKGDMAIEVQGPNKDALIAIAKIVVLRLK